MPTSDIVTQTPPAIEWAQVATARQLDTDLMVIDGLLEGIRTLCYVNSDIPAEAVKRLYAARMEIGKARKYMKLAQLRQETVEVAS